MIKHFINKMGTSGQAKKDPEDLMYFLVEDLTKAELVKVGKKKVVVNEEEIALISNNNKLYAIQEKCPHYGGPLHEGDIEELPEKNGFCVKCPWHSWKFDLSTGQCVSPANRNSKFVKTYPIRLDSTGQRISLGFTRISPEIFSKTPP